MYKRVPGVGRGMGEGGGDWFWPMMDFREEGGLEGVSDWTHFRE